MQLFCTYQESASFFPGYRAGTTLYDTKHCISNNQHTCVFSAQVYQLSVSTQTDGDTLQTSPIFPLCTIVPVPSLFPTVQCAVLPLVSLVPGVWRLTCGWCRLVGSIPPAAQLQHNRSPPSHHHLPHLHPPSSPSHTGESFIQYLGSYYNFRFQTSRQHHLQQTPICNVCIVSDIPSRDGGPGVSTAAL